MGHALSALTSAKLPERAPVVSSALDEELRLFLLKCLPPDEAGLRSLGFEMCVDHPQCPGHKYMEGYFHAFPQLQDGTVESVHPRFGAKHQRLAAPAPLLAFCEACRRANAALLLALENELRKSPTAAPLANVLQRHAHFADLSVQIHWGDEVSSQNVAWHIDAPNSFLHMALGLQGRRALHARRNVIKGRISGNCAVGPTDDKEVLWQDEGSAYVGSPCCYPHAVEYPAADWTNRIVAVQCRLHLSEDELFGALMGAKHTALDIDPNGGTAAIVFRHTDGVHFFMPKLADVQAVLQEFGNPRAECA